HTLGEYSKFGRRGRNFASVKWRGCTLHCDSEGNLTPFCFGFRMHNGIHQDSSLNFLRAPRSNLLPAWQKPR
ncbi:hypothetical protein N9B74_00250, partial [bacterium]|nr:hypothetical protein [bacterium]